MTTGHDVPRAGDRSRADVVRYWAAVEMFSTQPAPRVGADARVGETEPGRPVPWDPQHPLAAVDIGRDRVWRHAVYCGVYSREEAYAILATAFPPGDADMFFEPARDMGALAAFLVDQAGRPVEGSHGLAEAAWAIGRVAADGSQAVFDEGFAAAQAEFGEALGARAADPLSGADLAELADLALRLSGLEGRVALGPPRVRSYSTLTHLIDAPGVSEGVLLNSFAAEDLRRVGAAVRAGEYGHALWRYLAADDEVGPELRRDVERDEAAARDLLAPGRIPAGRWPAPPEQPLATGQQLAVNAAVGGLGHGGDILAVNGPPGTGKTTMLRDLIAAVVVDRARHLADLTRPEEAFAGAEPWGRSGGDRKVWRWADQLTGFEIVLACATNAAAENVTTEIPGIDAVDGPWREGADPLAELGGLVLRAAREGGGRAAAADSGTGSRAWGLVAACLGARQKGGDFAQAFWWGRLPGERRRRDSGQMAMALPVPAQTTDGLYRILTRAGRRTDGMQEVWAAAVARFRDAAVAERAHMERCQADGATIPGPGWWEDRQRRLRAAPWQDEGWNRARTEVFVAAIALHRALLMAAPRYMAQNLRAAVEIITGRVPSAISTTAARAAWQSLFMVVPVVSTTFASLPRVFAHLGREALGWLLIDEAGQVAPQMAVGGIWRARRVVAVGDPLQLEPIVTLPAATQEGLRGRHGVESLWVPAGVSAQRLADRVTHLGTRNGDSATEPELWVGAPLTLHRRCEEPMFSIVNAMAYGRRMVNGTPERPPIDLPPSAWLDVVGTEVEGHWLPAEGRRLHGVLEFLDRAGVDRGQIFMVSPFRDVARALERIAQNWGGGMTAGTVHTAQGREADVVILVLGGDPARRGALRWATQSPNLLNVAVSRARRRLWVIGNHAAWSNHPFADVIAAHLRVKGGPPAPSAD